MRSLVPLVVSLLFLGGLAAVPTAAAVPACGNAAAVTIDGTYHVQFVVPRSKVWEETNDLGGLQTITCTYGGQTYSPDTLRAGVPQDLGLLGICATLSVVSQCF